jgi:hypothetical protein
LRRRRRDLSLGRRCSAAISDALPTRDLSPSQSSEHNRVVPAKREAREPGPITTCVTTLESRWLWVPAFAGTTLLLLHHERKMSTTYRENYDLIDWSKELKVERKPRIAPPRSSLPAPMVIVDAIEVKSMVDGRIYTSKRALRNSYRTQGYVEIGNEIQAPKLRRASKQKISDSVEKAFARAGVS